MMERIWAWVWRLYQRICRKHRRPEYGTGSDGEPNS